MLLYFLCRNHLIQSSLTEVMRMFGILRRVACPDLHALLNRLLPALRALGQSYGNEDLFSEQLGETSSSAIELPRSVLDLFIFHLPVIVDCLSKCQPSSEQSQPTASDLHVWCASFHLGVLKTALLAPSEQVDPAARRAIELSYAQVQVGTHVLFFLCLCMCVCHSKELCQNGCILEAGLLER